MIVRGSQSFNLQTFTHFFIFLISTSPWLEEEEEAHIAVDKATETAEDEVEAKDKITLAQAALPREDCATLLAPACSTTARSQQQTRQDHHGKNLFNTLAQITDKK